MHGAVTGPAAACRAAPPLPPVARFRLARRAGLRRPLPPRVGRPRFRRVASRRPPPLRRCRLPLGARCRLACPACPDASCPPRCRAAGCRLACPACPDAYRWARPSNAPDECSHKAAPDPRSSHRKRPDPASPLRNRPRPRLSSLRRNASWTRMFRPALAVEAQGAVAGREAAVEAAAAAVDASAAVVDAAPRRAYLFWEKVQPLDDEAFDPLAHEYPLMLNWLEDEAKKRDAYDTSYGRDSSGEAGEERSCIKPNKGSDDDIEFVEHSEDWVGKYGPSKYKSSKYWTDVKSTPAKEDMDNRVDASFTTGNGNKLAREKGVHHNTPGIGDEGDPFVIEDTGNSPNPSLATVDTNDFPAITSTPKNMNEVSDGSSADKSKEISMDSLNTRIKNAKENGTPENDGKENDGKHKRKQSKYCLSPYQQNGGRKRAKKSLFGIRAAMINTDYINEDHIEAAKVYIRTLADSEKLCSKTVVHMTGIGGETCTPEMLEAIISKKWLHGGVINSYCNHMQTHNPRADRHILSSWVSHWLILRADGKVNNSKRHFMDHFANQTKMVSRVTEEYFIKDKAYFPFHVEENHWITVLKHNKKKEFQVLNSTGKCSKRVLAKIAKLRAEIANDTKEVNALIETEHPDVSSWPIREYGMPSQTDGVSRGLFVVKCVQNWDGDDWTFEFDQDEVNASRGHILAEILFSECNTKEVVKEKILKIMEKK
ncbi:uncharacterized protein [Aegilops tauschii subsp. strangulata]|uniref:uncharacterized protein n=1 Tax=Aegilops tauschii subsp. strangulata TaxID=200361 RepID=UPI00098A6BF5|nr:uncharacterized protein LOC109755073 [Aegilops tauschii subsp. strangulata]